MKRILIMIAVLVGMGGAGVAQAQSNNAQVVKETKKELNENRASLKAAKKAAAKKARELKDEVLHQQSVQAMQNKEFVLEAEQVFFKNGDFAWVQQNTNFISVQGDQSVVQLALSNINPGPNGIGGITLEGNITGYNIKTDSKGNTFLQMQVFGTSLSATVFITLYNNSQQAHATVSPDFNNNNIDFTGEVIPYGQSNVFKGQTTY